MTDLNEAIKQFDNTEANLKKLVKLWKEIVKLIPEGIFLGSNELHEEKCRVFREVLKVMPAIDGFVLDDKICDYNEIGQMRLDANEVGEIACIVGVEEAIFSQGRLLREYRFKFDRDRRSLIRNKTEELISKVDNLILELQRKNNDKKIPLPGSTDEWKSLTHSMTQLEVLLGSMKRPPRWYDMHRHLKWGEPCDLHDIINVDWPEIKPPLNNILYGEDDPIPVQTSDLSDLVKSKPTGEIISKLNWNKINEEDFERLIFNLISNQQEYRNPQWLTNTNAPDKGRDLSVEYIIEDKLGIFQKKRIIIQCKHILSKSISMKEIAPLREQMKLWEPPIVDILIIATSGRFTTDSVEYIEKFNQSDTALKIQMWPESHLEKLLARDTVLIAEFQLKK